MEHGGELGLVIIIGTLTGALIYGIAVDSLHNHEDRSLSKKDKMIQSANLATICRAVEKRRGRYRIGPSCGARHRSAFLAITLVGVPPDISLEGDERKQYAATCDEQDIVAKPTVQSILTSDGYRQVNVPQNTCLLTFEDSKIRKITISIRRIGTESASGLQRYLIRAADMKVSRSWYRTDGVAFAA